MPHRTRSASACRIRCRAPGTTSRSRPSLVRRRTGKTVATWRFKLDHGAAIEWHDLVRGPQHFDPALLSDPVIRREDASWLYMLPSTVDDIDMGVTHVVRGEDHVTNTALQIQMFEALGAPPPAFRSEEQTSELQSLMR